jgi:leucyl/phenylalanyl-tRNA--protein transferase
MPVFLLNDELVFPDPVHSEHDGLLAVGGDLSPERLLLAYQMGIFPWFSDESPILWWSPDPRMVLIPKNFKRSNSLRQTIRNRNFEVRFDTDFSQVIQQCAATTRKHEDGTWIIPEMIEAYKKLHELGFAHSVETYSDGKLVGGLYGISLGRAFFGESMFYTERDASKIALSALVDQMIKWDFLLIDAQQNTEHLGSMGAGPVSRLEFLWVLEEAMKYPTIKGKW